MLDGGFEGGARKMMEMRLDYYDDGERERWRRVAQTDGGGFKEGRYYIELKG